MTYPPTALLHSRSLEVWQSAEDDYDSALEVVGKRRKAWPLLRDLERIRKEVLMQLFGNGICGRLLLSRMIVFRYDISTYEAVFVRLTNAAKELQALEGGDGWSPERVQRCLWAINNKPKDSGGKSDPGKRKRES
ncbi:hypothetical protein FOZ63_029337 [Perkinsus olseni]|uniref:Uncharacterized protein n=1 Tax=Perkinsus olseni TaxID=32597 RepID=A0A7J6QM40_PEROL|nr:hypothetical protein FOZ62_002191 [Perkinsus olseni]KAF4746425.1 hypothetical protein FOZ63_029337 [Perkinsus olseni]